MDTMTKQINEMKTELIKQIKSNDELKQQNSTKDEEIAKLIETVDKLSSEVSKLNTKKGEVSRKKFKVLETTPTPVATENDDF